MAADQTDNDKNKSEREKIDQLHRADSIARRRIGKRKARRFQSASSSSLSNCRFRCRRADFLIARRSAATACFSACRSCRVRLSTERGK
jgi:hypothetical protein